MFSEVLIPSFGWKELIEKLFESLFVCGGAMPQQAFTSANWFLLRL
jgi:hypothetical protein